MQSIYTLISEDIAREQAVTGDVRGYRAVFDFEERPRFSKRRFSRAKAVGAYKVDVLHRWALKEIVSRNSASKQTPHLASVQSQKQA